MILWIDPDEVSAKIGERGSIFPVTADDVKWLDIRPESTAMSNQTHFIPQRPPISCQRDVSWNTPHSKLPFNQFMPPIGV
jgi:hypothetical protein